MILAKLGNTIQWKISFNSNHFIFSRKHQNINHDSINFNHNLLRNFHSQKHLGMHQDAKLNFQEHLDTIMGKVDKTIELLLKLQAVLPRPSLFTINKTLIFIFFSLTLIEWNNLDILIRNSESYATCKKSILKFLRHLKIPSSLVTILVELS